MKISPGIKFFVIIVIILTIVIVSANTIISIIIKNKINDNEVVWVDGLRFNIFTQSATLRDIQITNAKIDSLHVLNGTIARVDINRVGVIKFLREKVLEISSIELNDGNLTVSVLDSTIADSPAKPKSSTEIQEIICGSIEFNRWEFIYNDGSTMSAIAHLKNITTGEISITNIIDSVQINHSAVEVAIDSVIFTDSVSMYTIRADEIVADYNSNTIRIQKISIDPHYNYATFAKLSKYQTDRLQGVIDDLTIHVDNLDTLIAGALFKGQINIGSFNLDVYRDKHIPRKGNDIKKTVQQYLYDINFPIDIDSINIERGAVAYNERAENSEEHGTVHFRNISGTLTNVSNIQKDGALLAKASCVFMKSAQLQIDMSFPLDKNYFDCSGTITGLPLTQLNEISGPNGGVIFNSGNLNKIAFNMRADLDSAKGDLLMEYQDLDLVVMNKPDGDTTGVKSQVMSFIAGKLIVPNNNPQPGKPITPGYIRNPRNPERFIFNYIWKSIYSGITSTIFSSTQQKKNRLLEIFKKNEKN